MTSRVKRTHQLDTHPPAPPDRMDRRGFFRGAATLAVGGGIGASALLAPLQRNRAFGAEPEAEGAATGQQLAAQTQRALRWAGPDPTDWVRPRTGADHNVVIVGGGQSGLGIAYGLRRKGVGQVAIVDQSEPGQAGVWRTIARMRQLRTPKTIVGPEQGNPALGIRAWYETLHGEAAFDHLDRIPRLVWIRASTRDR